MLYPFLHNRLELSSISQRILYHLATRRQNVVLRSTQRVDLLLREVYPPILRRPSPLLRKLHHAAFAVEEEEVLRVRDWDRGVRLFGT